MRILQISHGYPPRENAGTERHTQQLTHGLRERGHQVHVVAATRAPGRAQYSLIKEDNVTRVVNNVSARPLAQGERDRAIEQILYRVVQDWRPDLVHFQHVQFLSSGLHFNLPSVLTLHDQWLWCPSGGLGLENGVPCIGPEPSRCVQCHANWRPVPRKMERLLTASAGRLSRWIAPERLHQMYRRLPASLRLSSKQQPQRKETADKATYRANLMRDFCNRTDVRIAPSRWLATQAEQQGMGPVTVIPHGVDGGLPRQGGGPFVYIGTIAHHKGPDLVVDAWNKAFHKHGPELLMHGPNTEPALIRNHPLSGPLNREEVWAVLSRATALVLGSRWNENAPLIILEARAAGCPVVAPRIGGIPELVESGRDGLLYEPDCVDSLVQAMQQVHTQQWTEIRPPVSHSEQVDATLAVYQNLIER